MAAVETPNHKGISVCSAQPTVYRRRAIVPNGSLSIDDNSAKDLCSSNDKK